MISSRSVERDSFLFVICVARVGSVVFDEMCKLKLTLAALKTRKNIETFTEMIYCIMMFNVLCYLVLC